MQITKEQNDAAGAIVELIADKLGNKRQIHPATAIAAGARLAGSFMFRSFNFDLKNASHGTAVLSEEANEKGPALINVLAGALDKYGLILDSNKMNTGSDAKSNLSFMDTLTRVQDQAKEIMNQYNLNFEQMSFSCALATAFIIKECQKDLEAETGFQTAVYGFIEGSKTFPPEFGSSSPKKKSIFKFWK